MKSFMLRLLVSIGSLKLTNITSSETEALAPKSYLARTMTGPDPSWLLVAPDSARSTFPAVSVTLEFVVIWMSGVFPVS